MWLMVPNNAKLTLHVKYLIKYKIVLFLIFHGTSEIYMNLNQHTKFIFY